MQIEKEHQPIGGYFSLEVNDGKEFHQNALRLNAGRYALEYILRARKYNKVYLPYYICDSVLQPLKRMGVAYEFYHIDDQLNTAEQLEPKADEAVLYVNYFGLKNQFSETFCHTYQNTILDQTQAFYSEKGRLQGKNKQDEDNLQCDTFYSCRKFFGVADGSYLYTNCFLNEDIPQDESFERMGFLMKRIDRSPQEGYADFHANDKALSDAGMRRMSKLTQRIMRGIDYTEKAKRRRHNFQILDNALRETNRFKWGIDNETVPMVYPYLIENGSALRQHLIDNQVFCARYWPNVLEWCKSGEWEYELTENLVAIPIDQRYNDDEMNKIIEFVNE